ncbi:DUF6702 family protein [Aridibaculum aurantiacum]|uniref:DUF6702 family protein n=1 Tax=Aridibaculum aurantiacum TaxID=2810307 RepID=UPI001A96AAE4|nr:DUF6702 family protein [Aridibaculum aurantiacum]
MSFLLNKYLVACVVGVFLLCTTANSTVYHPFYVSVTEMNYNAQSRSMEISCKMFVDDMEEVLKHNYKTAVDLGNAKLQEQNNRVIQDYIQRRLSLQIEGKPVQLKFVGFEKDKESVYCYFEVTDLAPSKKIAVSNSILYDLTKEQINIIHVMMNGKRQSTKLDNPKKDASFSF